MSLCLFYFILFCWFNFLFFFSSVLFVLFGGGGGFPSRLNVTVYLLDPAQSHSAIYDLDLSPV